MIGLRHLRNLLDGHGLTYNRGESGLGVTDPLFWVASYLLVKPLTWILSTPDVVVLHFVACFTFLIAGIALFCFARRGSERAASAAMMALFGVIFYWPLRFLYLGLEGPFMLCSVATIGFLASRWSGRRDVVVCLLVGILSWNRPEIAIITLPSVLFYSLLLSDRSKGMRSSLAYLGGVLAVPLLLKIFTGSFMAGTVRAKSYFGNPSPPLSAQFFIDRLKYLDAFIGLGSGLALLMLVIVFCIAIAGVVSFLRGPRTNMPWGSVYSAFVAGYSCFILVIPSLWEWYVTFWMAFALVLLGSRLVDCIAWAGAGSSRVASYTAAFSALLVAGSWMLINRIEPREVEIAGWIGQDSAFRGKLSRDLAERWHAKSVWMEAAGWQGYFNDARIFDEVGLVDDSTLPLAKKFGCSYFVSSVRVLKPEFIIKRQFEVERNQMLTPPKSCPNAPLFSSDDDKLWFFAHYERVETYQTEVPGYFGEYSLLDLYRLRKVGETLRVD